MSKYIDANKIQYYTNNYCKEIASKEDIDKLLTEDVAPVVHARWIVNRDYGDCTCSMCKTVYEDNGETIPDYWKYCPHCGAKMDE